MKRILYTDLSSGFGGSSSVLYDLLKNLDRGRFDPVVAVTRDGPNFEKIRGLDIRVMKKNLKVIGLVPARAKNSYGSLLFDLVFYFLPNTLVYLRLMKKEKVRLVHINNNIQFCVDVIFAAWLAGVPCVCHIRETRPPGKLDKLFGKLVDRIIVLNKNVWESFTRVFGSKKVTLIQDGLDLSDPALYGADASKVRRQFNLGRAFCVGMLGRLVQGKGFDDLILAAGIVKQKQKNIRFLIIGDDPDQEKGYQDHLKGMVRRLGLTEDVLFTGWRADKFDVIDALDVLVQASSYPEGFGLTCVEAMALSKPVIATTVPGPSDIVGNNVTGYLVDPGNPSLLAESIMKLTGSPETAREFGLAGRKRVEEEFDVRKNIRKIEKAYEDVLITTHQKKK